VEARRWYRQRKTRPETVVHPDRLDVRSTSADVSVGLGDPQVARVSASFVLPGGEGGEAVSTGWRPWSRIETRPVAVPSVGVHERPRDTLDRTYSRQYRRLYAMPYSANAKEALYAYPTSYSGRSDTRHFAAPGAQRETLSREGRDYVSLVEGSYRVKSYDRKVAHR